MIRLSCLNECTSVSSAFVKNEDMLLIRTLMLDSGRAPAQPAGFLSRSLFASDFVNTMNAPRVFTDSESNKSIQKRIQQLHGQRDI